MPNMSYCRFRNTLDDLEECADVLSEIDTLGELSEGEREAALRLLRLCNRLAADWEAEIEGGGHHG